MGETIFDGMQGWTHEASKIGLNAMIINALTGVDFHPNEEKVINQIMTFMIRDLEKKA